VRGSPEDSSVPFACLERGEGTRANPGAWVTSRVVMIQGYHITVDRPPPNPVEIVAEPACNGGSEHQGLSWIHSPSKAQTQRLVDTG
jgi:hypothetical protein